MMQHQEFRLLDVSLADLNEQVLELPKSARLVSITRHTIGSSWGVPPFTLWYWAKADEPPRRRMICRVAHPEPRPEPGSGYVFIAAVERKSGRTLYFYEYERAFFGAVAS